MFRLVLYMMASNGGPRSDGVLVALAYFFMLPNLVFPLFPVVDYQTFRRTYYDKDDGEIYKQGMLWIARGLVHLLLYRFVYHAPDRRPESIVDARRSRRSSCWRRSSSTCACRDSST